VPKFTFPKRHKHADVRSREYLTAAEVTRLRKASGLSRRWGISMGMRVPFYGPHCGRVSSHLHTPRHGAASLPCRAPPWGDSHRAAALRLGLIDALQLALPPHHGFLQRLLPGGVIREHVGNNPLRTGLLRLAV
jgi:hypothetical protein